MLEESEVRRKKTKTGQATCHALQTSKVWSLGRSWIQSFITDGRRHPAPTMDSAIHGDCFGHALDGALLARSACMMKLANVGSIGALLSSALLALACSGASSEDPPATEGTPPAGDPAQQLPGQPGGPTTPAGPSGTPTPGGTAPAPTTPAPPTQPPNSGVFTNAPQYIATLGPSTIDLSGKGNGHLSFNKDGNPAGRACLDCHDGTGKGGAPKFLFAGTIYQDAAGTKVSAKVEVRLVGADGKALTTYTDNNGNYFFRESAGTATVPAMAGARNASASRTMVNKINNGNCNQCHGVASRILL
jgi:hypothetical protein